MSLSAFALAAEPIAETRMVKLIPKRVPPKRTTVALRDRELTPEAR